ncbi:MAG: hypothetical protein M3069_10715, partial [Chloroflexota bacterium]|nr:hypothetical protein [Chloroflexota bacterium]
MPRQYVSDVQPSPTPTAAPKPIVPSAPTAFATLNALQPTRQIVPTIDQPQIAAAGFFTIGSTLDQVLAVEGSPSGRYPTYWAYGLATVSFDQQGRVVGWTNADSKLHVNLAGAKSSPEKLFTVNSSTAEVAAVQGVPSGYYP